MRKAAVALAVLASLMVGVAAVAQDKNKPKPTGACTIEVYGISPTCTSPMTQNACYAAAARVGGVASWAEGQSCPRR